MLSDKDSMLKTILDAVNDGILISDEEGRIVAYNKALEKLENKKAQEMVGRFLWDAYGYLDPGRSEHLQVRSSGTPILRRYSAHSYEGNQARFLSYSTWPLYEEGKIVGAFSVCRNEDYLRNLLSDTVELRRSYQAKGNFPLGKMQPNGTQFVFSDIVGRSRQIQELIQEAQAISWLDNPVLIAGETGTGKEVFAQSIHNYSKRSAEPFIAMNCSAIPENLMESIFFGTVRGAFTGAENQIGIFEQAGKGTVFLDELNSMPLSMQAKLLRVLQEKQVRRVGSSQMRPVDCRITSAMNEDPRDLMKKQGFRQDLFYRLSGFHLHIPPLRERKEDILELAAYFIRRYASGMNRQILGITRELEGIFEEYPWPGNIRELEHLIENMLVRTTQEDRLISIQHIPDYLKSAFLTGNHGAQSSKKAMELPQILLRVEEQLITEALRQHQYNITKTAHALGIIRQSLLYRMKKLGIDKSDQEP